MERGLGGIMSGQPSDLIAAESEGVPAQGLFIVDLRGLRLSEKQLQEINGDILDVVQKRLASISDLESTRLAALGPGVLGITTT
jgi:glycerol-3-phosphate responsive antiterminator